MKFPIMQSDEHSHEHTHEDGTRHSHGHGHSDYDHDHLHSAPGPTHADDSKHNNAAEAITSAAKSPVTRLRHGS